MSKADLYLGSRVAYYELCGKLSNGLSYMLHSRMHNSLKMSIPVSLIVGDWVS
jgi:hypothetical protein